MKQGLFLRNQSKISQSTVFSCERQTFQLSSAGLFTRLSWKQTFNMAACARASVLSRGLAVSPAKGFHHRFKREEEPVLLHEDIPTYS